MPDAFKEATTAYYQALGKFVDHFAAVESALLWFLSRLASVDEPTSRAIFSGVRADQAISFIKRLHEARRQPLNETLAKTFDHFTQINRYRNDILHYGVNRSGFVGGSYF